MLRDHLRLQGIIVLWGLTAVLGDLITLSALHLVAYRTLIAALFILLWRRQRSFVSRKLALQFTVTGFVIGLHWMTFFLAVKVANVSICMIGVATLSFWTAVFEPIMVRGRNFRPIDLIFGSVVVGGVAFIFKSEASYSNGLLIALLSAILAAIFSVLNCFHVHKAHHLAITFYEMIGACLVTVLALSFSASEVMVIPPPADWGWLLILSIFCTVVAFSQYVELLKRIGVFTMNFAANLEPVYGIILAALILGDHKQLTPSFYLGASIIMIAILSYPVIRRQIVRNRDRQI